jgi:hypothetical protein
MAKSPSERRAAMVRLVESRTVTRVAPPLLLPASPYLELAGEEFGRSLLLSTANNGIEYCLRPDFTLPIAKSYLDDGMTGVPGAYTYLGPIFRQENGVPVEYEQAGLELLGQPDANAALDQVLTFARRPACAGTARAPRTPTTRPAHRAPRPSSSCPAPSASPVRPVPSSQSHALPIPFRAPPRPPSPPVHVQREAREPGHVPDPYNARTSPVQPGPQRSAHFVRGARRTAVVPGQRAIHPATLTP